MFDEAQLPFIRRRGHKETLYRHILTAADENFFDSVLILIDSIYAQSYHEFYQISVYDLGLNDKQRATLNAIPRVKIMRIPNRKIDEDYVKNYFFKVDFMYLAQYLTPTNFDKTLFLYIDAGIIANAPLSLVWKEINDSGYFITDMADRTAWEKTGDKILLFNTFPDELTDCELDTDFDLLSKPLLRPGIFGFKLHSQFFTDVIEEGYKLSRAHPEYLRGEKFTGVKLDDRHELFLRLRDYQDENEIDRCIDDFIGHRLDQFLFSYLIHKSRYAHKSAEGVTRDITHAFASRKNLSGESAQTVSRKDIAGKYKDVFLIHRNTVINDVDVERFTNRFRFDNYAVKEKIRGKRVAIVGPAKHVYETEAGADIDSFDLVCRVNKYRKDDRFAKNIGGRCDILVHCISETEITGGPISEVDFTTNDPCIISPYALLDDFDQPSTFQPYYGNVKNFKNYFRNYKHKIFAPPNSAYIRFEEALGSRPNSGFAGIVTLLEFEPEELYVTGFTFFSGGYHPSYREETEHEVLTSMETRGFHDQKAQLDFFVQRIVNNPRLKIDAPLAEIVNKRLCEMAQAPSGKRLAIIGNGPTLKGFDFRTLRNKPTVSFNRAYIIYEEQNFYPVYYFCVDKAVLLNCLKDIEKLLDSPIQKFVLLDCDETTHLTGHEKVTLVKKDPANSKFFGDVATYSLYHLMNEGYKGFDIYGCDCSYIEDIDQLNVDVEHNENDPARRIVLKPRKGASDPNHFLPNYFGEGTEYSVPRESNHYKCWENVKSMATDRKVEICFRTPSKVSHLFSFNPNPEKSPERFYNNAPALPKEAPDLLHDMPRTMHAHTDETRVIAHLLRGQRGDKHFMIDVGAHHGVTSKLFHDFGWRVYCCEPDPENRKTLFERYKGADRVVIDPRAVSDKPQKDAAFFTSEESNGISALHAFRHTHKPTAKVDVTTIADIIADTNAASVDFLKIDVEGFDFAVLKGVPWDKIQPDVIECEFEDGKTEKLGYTVNELAAFLEGKGYTVYVSEWHPIIRYGIRHDWRRILPLAQADLKSSAWGNLLAFRKDPGLAAIKAAVMTVLKVKPEKAKTPLAAAKAAAAITAAQAPAPATPFYASFGEWVRKRSPRIFTLLQLGRRALAGLWRRKKWTAPTFSLLALIALSGFMPGLAGYRALIWGAAAFGVAMFAIFYLGLRTYQFAIAFTAELTALRQEASRLKGSLSKAEAKLNESEMTQKHMAQVMLKNIDDEVQRNHKDLSARYGQLVQKQTAIGTEQDKHKSAIAELESKMGNASTAQNWIKTNIAQLKSEAVAIDLISAVRSLRPLWLGGSAIERFNDQVEYEHGHAILMAVLADEARANPGILQGKNLIEIGTTRELISNQKSTEKLALFAALTDMNFVTVDMDPENAARANQILRLINPSAHAIAQKGEDYLAEQPGPLDYIYLDAFDFEHDRHSAKRQERYQSILNTAITNEACWRMHQECAVSIVQKMRKGGIVALDDTWTDEAGAYQGKGKMALPYLLENGFEIITFNRTTYCLKRTTEPIA